MIKAPKIMCKNAQNNRPERVIISHHMIDDIDMSIL